MKIDLNQHYLNSDLMLMHNAGMLDAALCVVYTKSISSLK